MCSAKRARNTYQVFFHNSAALAAALLLLLAAAVPAAAQDEGDFSEGFSVSGDASGTGAGDSTEDDAGDSSSAGGSGESAEDSSSADGSEESTGFSSFGSSAEQPALEWGGFLNTTARFTADYGEPGSGAVDTYPELGLNLSYSKEHSEAKAELRFSRNWNHEQGLGSLFEEAAGDISDPADNVEPAMNLKWYLQRMINEAYLRLFYDNFDVQAGFIKEVWGTGDQVHAVDPLNAADYYDYVNPDYIDRKLAEFMIKGSFRLGQNGSLELVYAPGFTPDAIPQTGSWKPTQVESLQELMAALSGTTAFHYPGDYTSLDDGQYALRATGILGGVDLGAVYYYGRSHQAALSGENYLSLPGGDVPQDIYIDYPRMHLFGVESAAVLAGFNLRAEAAFTMTGDWKDDRVYETRTDNPAIRYVAGFDRNLPLSNLNLNIQGNGAYYFNVGPDSEALDSTLSLALTDSWNNATIEPELSVSYNAQGTDVFADPDLMAGAKITFTLVDDVTLEADYTLFYGPDEGRFGQFDDNDYLQLSLSYAF